MAGGHIWVANRDTVTELDATTGGLEAVISGAQYGFDGGVIAAVGQ